MEISRELVLFDLTTVGQIEQYRDYLVIAKNILSLHSVGSSTSYNKRFFVKTVGNRLVHPAQNTIYELKKNDGHFIEVDKDVYDTYIKVINGKSAVPLRSLEMRVLNG